ncbi:MAG: peptidase M16 [Sulfurimonas sp. RIFCSPHIGHO2_12_FULL_36_9]|nr:MAG: peptidase M16 [Sulfurimonas sp. RIFCSPHIGHO2_12_FULL_36_9]OHE02947.1 MAG: peptidase M16 [Sulfurimonas sp. RIFCSPLOWO2_12_36_12]OHE07886.1 MAG: peptidase M16 [Sulfurimonas sp. RIFCSPLOWO2_12_FULL_36_74]
MKKAILTLLILGNIIMAATIEDIKVKDTNIPLIFEQDKRLPLVTIQFIFKNSGSVADTTKAGLAKFSAKVMNEGTKKLGSSAFAEELESKAIHISASTGKETFVIEVGCLKEELDNGLKYFDMLLKDPNLAQDAIDKVKTTTLGSLARKENDFDYIASSELNALLFEGSVLANPSLGTVESVKSIELEDVKKFLTDNLVISKLMVVVGGDIEAEDVKTKVTKIIKSMAVGENGEVKNYSVTKEPKEKIVKKETEQAYIYFGSPYNISVNSEDYYKARVATFILGSSGFGSRLMEEIRVKRGLAYSAYARIDVTKSSSCMSGHLQTKLDSLEEAKKTVKDVVAQFVKEGVTKDELEQTKKFLLGSEPLRVETMSQRLNRTFMEYYNSQELGHSLKELELIGKLSLKDLNDFIKAHKEILDMSFAIVTKL